MTEREGWTGKYLARGHAVRTERRTHDSLHYGFSMELREQGRTGHIMIQLKTQRRVSDTPTK